MMQLWDVMQICSLSQMVYLPVINSSAADSCLAPLLGFHLYTRAAMQLFHKRFATNPFVRILWESIPVFPLVRSPAQHSDLCPSTYTPKIETADSARNSKDETFRWWSWTQSCDSGLNIKVFPWTPTVLPFVSFGSFVFGLWQSCLVF